MPEVAPVWDIPYHILSALFSIIRPPRTKIRLPKVSSPSPMVMFAIIFFTIMLISSGVIYDILVAPPSMGYETDPATGAQKPQAVLPGRMQGQYIVEGLSAGMFFAISSLGLILLDQANSRNLSFKNRYILLSIGVVMFILGHLMLKTYTEMKISGYLKGFSA